MFPKKWRVKWHRSLGRWWKRHASDLALGIERIGDLHRCAFQERSDCWRSYWRCSVDLASPGSRSTISLSQLFHSDTPDFRLYQQETRRFPSSELDVLVVVQGKTLLQRASIEKLRNLVINLQLIDGARGIISLFSAREPPAVGKLPGPLIPNELPQGADYEQLVQRIKSNEIFATNCSPGTAP